jgi:hypothetical protein
MHRCLRALARVQAAFVSVGQVATSSTTASVARTAHQLRTVVNRLFSVETVSGDMKYGKSRVQASFPGQK